MIQRVVAMVAVLLLSTAALSAPSPSGSESGWWEDTPWRNPDRGFNWYPPDTPPKKADKKAADKPKPIKDMKTMEELQKELARLKDLAIMQPTQANVRSYLEAQTYVMDKSSLFADVARRVVWATPSVDYNSRSPTATFAQLSKKDIHIWQFTGQRDGVTRKLCGALPDTHRHLALVDGLFAGLPAEKYSSLEFVRCHVTLIPNCRFNPVCN